VIKSTDRQIYPNIYMALSCIYNSTYKPEQCAEIGTTIKKAMPMLYKMLKVKPGIKVRVAPIKARHTRGSYYHGSRVIVIDPRFPDSFLHTLCHEMVHAEQYDEGRLEWCGVHRWHGAPVRTGSTYASYRNLPWEVEAYERQDGLAAQLKSQLGMV
jgi:hypothetical protein